MHGLDRMIERARRGEAKAAEQLRRIFHAGRSAGDVDARLRRYVAAALGATNAGTDPATALNAQAAAGEGGERGVAGHPTDSLLVASVASWIEDHDASFAQALQWTAEAWSLTDVAAVRDAVGRRRPDLMG